MAMASSHRLPLSMARVCRGGHCDLDSHAQAAAQFLGTAICVQNRKRYHYPTLAGLFRAGENGAMHGAPQDPSERCPLCGSQLDLDWMVRATLASGQDGPDPWLRLGTCESCDQTFVERYHEPNPQ